MSLSTPRLTGAAASDSDGSDEKRIKLGKAMDASLLLAVSARVPASSAEELVAIHIAADERYVAFCRMATLTQDVKVANV
ncbi:hypothetical protein LTR49_025139 [Elasticomyces elasticus]|nr:hypothetical protein LTR49_025139 [Elasticomyces elasticus]